MADRIITVTDPSVVTNDTLSGYNNYSDIDGQLGTTMTPTEATNGHTVALSDGVVHEVTTKPVGTTNGEFSAVISNAVSVDLSGGAASFIDFDYTGADGGAQLTETATEGTWEGTGGGTNTGAYNYGGRTTGFTGDFEYTILVETKTGTAGGYYRFALDSTPSLPPSGAGQFNTDYAAHMSFTLETVKAYTGATASADLVTLTYQPGDTLRFVRVGTSLKLYLNATELFEWTDVSVTLYPYLATALTFIHEDVSVIE